MTDSTWETSRHLEHKDYTPPVGWKEFFSGLNTGDFVRYGKTSDTTSPEGCHAIVFRDSDDNGIWVYECNQSYVASDPNNNYYGCGVFIQYYTYERLNTQYQFAAYYIHYTYNGGKTMYNASSHKVMCSGADVKSSLASNADYVEGETHHVECTDYVVQAHTGTYTYTSQGLIGHQITYSCCDGSVVEPHTIAGNACFACGYVGSYIGFENPEVPLEE